MIEAIAPLVGVAPTLLTQTADVATPRMTEGMSFQQILQTGIEVTNNKIARADEMVAQFAVDGSLPAHQVTYALEEARLSLELMIQVRNRLLEGYQQIMNMQV